MPITLQETRVFQAGDVLFDVGMGTPDAVEL